MTKVYVLDTAPLLSDWTKRVPGSLFMTTQQVVDEIVNRTSTQRLQTLISSDRLKLESAEANDVTSVRKKATEVGDIGNLSDTDVEIVALALSKARLGLDVILVSSDLAVLNTASSLGLGVLDSEDRLRDRVVWAYKCPACGTTTAEPTRDQECPTCGTRMRRRAQQRTRIR